MQIHDLAATYLRQVSVMLHLSPQLYLNQFVSVSISKQLSADSALFSN